MLILPGRRSVLEDVSYVLGYVIQQVQFCSTVFDLFPGRHGLIQRDLENLLHLDRPPLLNNPSPMMKSSIVMTNTDSMSVACLEAIAKTWKENMQIYIKVPKALFFYIFPPGLEEYQNSLVALYPRYHKILFCLLFSFEQLTLLCFSMVVLGFILLGIH